MQYQVLFGTVWEDVEEPQELAPAPDSPQSVGWLKFKKDGNDMLARPEGWRKQ
jgi:hypothetical protein